MLVQSNPVTGATLDAWRILVPVQCSPIIGATLDMSWIFKKITEDSVQHMFSHCNSNCQVTGQNFSRNLIFCAQVRHASIN